MPEHDEQKVCGLGQACWFPLLQSKDEPDLQNSPEALEMSDSSNAKMSFQALRSQPGSAEASPKFGNDIDQ